MRVRTKSSVDWYLHKSSSSPSVFDTFHCSDSECTRWVQDTVTVQNLNSSFDFPCTVIKDEDDTDLGSFSFSFPRSVLRSGLSIDSGTVRATNPQSMKTK